MRFRPLLYNTHGMEWVSTSNVDHHGELQRGVLKSIEEIHSFSVLHLDLRADNILWNAELGGRTDAYAFEKLYGFLLGTA